MALYDAFVSYTHWRMQATTREPCKRGLGIAISSTPYATRS